MNARARSLYTGGGDDPAFAHRGRQSQHKIKAPCSSFNLEYYLKMSVASLMSIHPIVAEGKVRNSAKVTRKYNLGAINVSTRICAIPSNRR